MLRKLAREVVIFCLISSVLATVGYAVFLHVIESPAAPVKLDMSTSVPIPSDATIGRLAPDYNALAKQAGAIASWHSCQFYNPFQKYGGTIRGETELLISPDGKEGCKVPKNRVKDAKAEGYKVGDVFDQAATDNLIPSPTPGFLNDGAAPPRKDRIDGLIELGTRIGLCLVVGVAIGFPFGFVIWGFYRMTRFAITG